jgi:hypothetical protein
MILVKTNHPCLRVGRHRRQAGCDQYQPSIADRRSVNTHDQIKGDGTSVPTLILIRAPFSWRGDRSVQEREREREIVVYGMSDGLSGKWWHGEHMRVMRSLNGAHSMTAATLFDGGSLGCSSSSGALAMVAWPRRDDAGRIRSAWGEAGQRKAEAVEVGQIRPTQSGACRRRPDPIVARCNTSCYKLPHHGH